MKQKIFTFLLIIATGLTACKKHDNQPDIRTYDEEQIQRYIAANGLTGFTADNTPDGTGTTGMYYKILSQGSGDTLKYSDLVSLVYTVKSFDGKYVQSDTITNHIFGYLGYLSVANATTGFYLPKGLQLAIHNILKYKGSSMRLLIPSRMAYGVNGLGPGNTTVNINIAGNQCLEYYVNIIGNQSAYDDKVINNYIAANNLSGYAKDFAYIDSSGTQLKKYYYYKIVTPGTGAAGAISEFSKVTTTYGGSILNGFSFDYANYTTPTVLVPFQSIEGVKHALINHATTGTSLQLLIPSSLGYGFTATTGIPANSVLKFDFTVSGIDL